MSDTPTITLCLLTFNELEGCRHDLPNLPLDQFDAVYALDGGSHDGTDTFLREQGITVHTQQTPGYNAAYLEAFEHCQTDVLVLFHPKGSIDPLAVLQFKPLFEAGHDLVVASRLGSGAHNEEDDQLLKPRKWFVQGISMLAALIWRRDRGAHVWDVLHGLRGMRVAAFKAIAPRDYGLSIDLEMVVRSYRLKLKRAEFPVHERARLAGQTHFKALPTGWKLLKYMASELVRPKT
ncbi:glycosyltransferase [Magnetococcus sp. PR-3]|uniref:glycosyltransferase n=1 Tax=Magnetococcus sp. PR-3 TaxID=3120355 RepID=UPI002FCDE899